MQDRVRFLLNSIREQLWVKPFVICLLSISATLIAQLADKIQFLRHVPDIAANSLTILLGIISASMLGISVFAVGSMISAYASASNTATPRSFTLVISDDVSQNALSSFIGAFIFSIIAIVALENGFYGIAGRFILFLITMMVFAVIILNFLRWLDRIARLGRLGDTIEKVETVTDDALRRYRQSPTLRAKAANHKENGVPIFSDTIGYVQRIDIPILQAAAEQIKAQITVAVLPGTFVAPGQAIAVIHDHEEQQHEEINGKSISKAFVIDKDRAFIEDPRFGLVVLSEIASRALSPAVNDPGTAICVIDSFVRLFSTWAAIEPDSEISFDRVWVPTLSIDEMFDHAFNALARDGSGTIEVVLRLQKAFISLNSISNNALKQAASTHAFIAYQYAKNALTLPEEHALLEKHAQIFGFDKSH
jgi:uncharacterized membrane protein